MATTAAEDSSTVIFNATFIAAWNQKFKPFFEVKELMWKTVSPVILLFGVFGNIMIILVMRRFSVSSLNVFFQVLAWSDLLLLLTGLLPNWLNNLFDAAYIEDLGSWPCKIYKVIIYTVGVVSPWMLVALTMQRAASVLWPHRVNAVWTKGKSRAVAAVLTLAFTLVHTHFLYGWAYDEKLCGDYVTNCCPVVVSAGYGWFHHTVWPWVDLVQFSLLPFVLLAGANTVLIWKLVASSRETRHQLATGSQESREKSVSSLTVTLLAVSLSFFCLTTPLSLYFIIRPYILTPEQVSTHPVLAGILFVYLAVANLMWYANSAINFYIYCLTGTKFRTELKTLMRPITRGLFHEERGPMMAGEQISNLSSSAAMAPSEAAAAAQKKKWDRKYGHAEF